MASFLNELRHRNVLKVAAAYALVAWILIEAGSVLLPTFGAPEWFFQIYVIIVIGGWIMSMIIAWIFEATPEGVKLERDIDRSTYRPPPTGGMNWIIIGLLVIALGVSISFNIFGLRHQDVNASIDTERNSIAVLPFDYRSSDPESRFFTDGIHDDLLTRLSGIESLRVISRTSVMEYRDTPKNLRQIGNELDVATVVEGAVQQYGNKVRITVQLIDAATDEQIWAASYDRELTMEDVFDIQSEISSEIASSLRAALTPEDQLRLAAVPTTNIDAYTLYAAGQRNLYRRRFETVQAARQQFERAIDIDPEYAEAYAGLAQSVLLLFINHSAISPREAYDIAGRATARALELDRDLALAHALVGLIEAKQWSLTRLGDGNQKAAASYRRALELNPNLADAYVWYSSLLESEGKFDESIERLRQALQIDPLGRIPYINLPSMLAAKGESQQTIELLLNSMEIFPNWPLPYEYLTRHLERLGRLDESLAWNLRAEELSEDPLTGAKLLPIYHELGYLELIDEFVDNFPNDHPMYPIGVGYLHFLNEEYEQAVATLDPAVKDSTWPIEMVYPVLIRAAVLLGDYDMAYDYLLRSFPTLSADRRITVDRMTLGAVVMMAFLDQRRGNGAFAEELLDQALDVARELPRGGLKGHGITDVQILALQGRNEAALDALRDAIDEGFVSLVPFDMWGIDQDPMIDGLRNNPRYERMRVELEERLGVLRQEIEHAHSTGDWQTLRDKVQST